LVQGVVAGLRQFATRRDLPADFHQARFQRRQDRGALLLAQVPSWVRPQARFAGFFFHLVNLADAGEDFHRQRILRRQFGRVATKEGFATKEHKVRKEKPA